MKTSSGEKRFRALLSSAVIVFAGWSTGPAQTIRIDAGGAATGLFASDEDYNGGLTASTGASVETTGVPYAAAQAMYQSERWGPATYTIPHLPAGKPFIVRLHFAETFWSQPGQRVFNVALNGVPVLTNFDILATAGGAGKAVVESFPVDADASGAVTIALTPGPADNPKICGIELLPGLDAAPRQGSSPAPIPTVYSAEALGTVVQNSHVIGRDGTWTALIDGKSYWSFNDTSLMQTNAEGANFISNSRSWTDSLNAADGITLEHDYLDSAGLPTEYMPFTVEEAAFNAVNENTSGYPGDLCSPTIDPTCGEDYAIWPGPVIPVPNSPTHRVYHFYALIQRGGPIAFFNVLGTSIAVEDNGVITRPVLSPGAPYPTLFWQGSQVGYSSGGRVENGILYMLGCGNGQADFGYPQCYVGKVPIDDATTKAAWSYYDPGTGTWIADQTQAQKQALFTGGAGGNSIEYVAALNEWMAVYNQTYTDNAVFRVAPTPWGPWSAEQQMFTGQPTIRAGGANDYAGQAHPEFEEQNGLVQYVTYVQDDGALGFNGQNIQLVRVQFNHP